MARSHVRALVLVPLKLLWAASVVVIPAIGVWLASSLAAYRNGPVWLACLCGLLLFPGLPLLWDGLATWRRSRKKPKPPRILTFWDRLVLRTLAINLATLTILVARAPETTFAALSTRGDWFLDGHDGPRAEHLRSRLFTLADRLEWLYSLAHPKTFADLQTDHSPPPPPPQQQSVGPSTSSPTPTPNAPQGTSAPPALWPSPPQLHPLVANMPAAAEQSITTVGRYIADHEPDPVRKVQALHDYVADRIAYDAEAYADGRYPPQDAETVFATRLGVCAGYAQLLTALGDVADAQIVTVTGDARVQPGDVTGEGHAWNAVQIDGQWYLLDTTWDSGSVNGRTFTKNFSTNYLFTPPDVFITTHFPNDPAWQLLASPRSRGDFFRAPIMRAQFYADGFELITPDRSQVTVDHTFEAILNNPQGRFMLAKASIGDTSNKCTITAGPQVKIHCPLAQPGTYKITMFSGPEEYGQFTSVGSFEALRP